MKQAETLAEIEQLDQRRQELEAEAAAIRERAAGDPELQQLVDRNASLEGQGQRLASALKQAELEVEELRQRARDHERAIYDGSVRNPAGLQRRQHELQTLRDKIAPMEEAEISQMEEQERLGQELSEVGQLIELRREQLAKARQQDSRRAPQLEAELQELGQQRVELVESVAPAALRLYERTGARRRPAVAKVVSGVCSGCRLPLAPRLLEAARRDELVGCENCERILLL